MQLSANFTREELCYSKKAVEIGLANIPNDNQTARLAVLARRVLQVIRDRWGRVVSISGFRCPELNRIVGGEATSQHMHGDADDFHTPDADLLEVFNWCRAGGVDFDQLIWEGTWIHISYRSPEENRHEVLRCVRDGTGKHYLPVN